MKTVVLFLFLLTITLVGCVKKYPDDEPKPMKCVDCVINISINQQGKPSLFESKTYNFCGSDEQILEYERNNSKRYEMSSFTRTEVTTCKR